MNTHTKNFLKTLLFVADIDERAVHDFSPAFIAGVESFIDGFTEYLTAKGFDLDRLDELERSFGGNVFLSLSGHGAGFWDDSGPIGDELNAMLLAYSGRPYRFEELETSIDWEDGELDLAILPEYLEARRAALFAVARP